jgi:hypothetical protein
MEDYGGLWRIMKDYGGLWRVMEGYERLAGIRCSNLFQTLITLWLESVEFRV